MTLERMWKPFNVWGPKKFKTIFFFSITHFLSLCSTWWFSQNSNYGILRLVQRAFSIKTGKLPFHFHQHEQFNLACIIMCKCSVHDRSLKMNKCVSLICFASSACLIISYNYQGIKDSGNFSIVCHLICNSIMTRISGIQALTKDPGILAVRWI